MRATCSAHLDHPNNILWRVQIMELLITRFYLASCHFIPLRSKYSPKHPVLKHPQSVLFPWCERPSFTPIQYNR
jgi:hypothetical protein